MRAVPRKAVGHVACRNVGCVLVAASDRARSGFRARGWRLLLRLCGLKVIRDLRRYSRTAVQSGAAVAGAHQQAPSPAQDRPHLMVRNIRCAATPDLKLAGSHPDRAKIAPPSRLRYNRSAAAPVPVDGGVRVFLALRPW